MSLKDFDWRKFKRYTSPQAVKDFDEFLDAMPVNVGYNALIAAGFAWILAGGAVLFASMQASEVSKLRSELMEIEAMQPPIPDIEYTPVPMTQLEEMARKIEGLYPGITILVDSDGALTISGNAVGYYPQFRAAISHVQNWGKSWRVRFDTMCMGRECQGPSLQAAVKVESAMVQTVDPGSAMAERKKKKDGDGGE